ncbi:DUF4142 domain-containing protein [Ferruginibacter sp.]
MRKVKHFKLLPAWVFLLTAGLLFVLSCNKGIKRGDKNNTNGENNKPKLNMESDTNDEYFLLNAAEINLLQINLAHLAQQNGMIADVKELGKKMEDFYSRSFQYLIVLTTNKFIPIPITTDNAVNVYNNLSKKSGNDFDKAYCDIMVKDHKYAIVQFEKVGVKSGDAAVRHWAKSMLADLRIQLSNAIACQMKCSEISINKVSNKTSVVKI